MRDYSTISIEDLLRRCSISGEIEAWEEFVRRFHRVIATVVLRTARRWGDSSKQTVDDLIQETYLKLCVNDYRILRDFDHREADAFVGYVKVVAANMVRDHFKSSYSKKRGANKIDSLAEGFVPVAEEGDEGTAEAIEHSVLMNDVERHLQGCISGPDEGRNSKVFWLYYRVGLSAAAIAALPGIGLSTKGVESLIFRITGELRKQIMPPSSDSPTLAPDSSEGILSAESF
jgi:RNA polymerase sigma-70 factor (ECF subfamily)